MREKVVLPRRVRPVVESGSPPEKAMLVLSRKKNESIVVDDAIVITVIEIRGDKVRLGIEAPREVAIHRSEVYAAIQSNSQSDGMPESASPPESETAAS